MPRADGAFTIPSGSPMATGWRATLAELLDRHGLHQMLDAIAAYAELRVRHEPDNCSAAEEAAQGGWFKIAAPAQRRIDVLDLPLPDAPRRGRPRIYD